MKLFFRKYGEGPPLVLLHGLYGSSDNWLTIARSISRDFTVFLPDMRNHGKSPHSDTHDYDAMSSDIFEFASDNNLQKFFLAGHSMGGKAAVRFAMRWPELLSGLLVADISPFETQTSNSESYAQHLEILKTLASTDIREVHSREELEKILSVRIRSEKILRLILKNVNRDDDGSFSWKINNSSLLKNIGRIIDKVADIQDFEEPITGFPVLFLRGESSGYLPLSDFDRIRRLFPAAEFRIITNAGHWIHADNPEEVINAFKSLLQG